MDADRQGEGPLSVAAVMLVKDEADIIEATIRHLCDQVDEVLVTDNMSTDGTEGILADLYLEGLPLQLRKDEEVGYRQSEKTTELATRARDAGHAWVVPVDADEIWYSPFGRVGDVLEGLPEWALFASAGILNHVASGDDDPREADPTRRLTYRIREEGELPKVACRALDGLRIGMGNHDATARATVTFSSARSVTLDGQLYIHHFPWRSEEQFLRKIRNGAIAYAAAPEIAKDYGAHWRAFGMPDEPGFEDRVRSWFWEWGYRDRPSMLPDVVYDPAPR